MVGPGGIFDALEVFVMSWDPFRGDHALNMLSRTWSRIAKNFPNTDRTGSAVQNLINKLATGRGKSGYPRDRVWETPMYETEPIDGERAHELLGEFMRDVFGSGAAFGVDDTPYSALHGLRVRSLFPECTFVAVVRDPKDVLSSTMERKWAPKNWNDCAHRIATTMKRILDDFDLDPEEPDPGSVLLRLEDLVKRPKEILSDFARHSLELEWDDAWELPIREADAHIGRGARLPVEGLDAYNAHLAGVADALGYG